MHHVVAYDGIVLGKRPRGESDTVIYVLTPEGLLRAKATSARAEKSKLRYGLEPLTRGRYSFVQGKREWKLTGVEAVSRAYLAAPLLQRQAIARAGKLLLRLVHGEEPSGDLYKTVVEGFTSLAEVKLPEENGLAREGLDPRRENRGSFRKEVSPEAESIEVVLVLRILSHLGYLPHTEALAPFVDGGFTVELSAKALQSRALLVRTINESLQATGL